MSKKFLSLLGWIWLGIGTVLFAILRSLITEEIMIIEEFAIVIWCFLISIFLMVYIGQLLESFKEWWKE